ncbi:MAG: DUF6472 family protein [Lachnospiraceae bacterium]|nr:DUF6472 family protein [Lachnospiraceae bacterium]MCR5388012.1 DUF6472 family protein [Lachnospiraceae bacterium]
MDNLCDMCAYNAYDDEYDEYYCSADMDEDDFYHFLTDKSSGCKFFKDGDEYKVVRHQAF